MQLESFLEDPQYQDQHSLHMEIIRTFGRVGPNAEPRFRDECEYTPNKQTDTPLRDSVESEARHQAGSRAVASCSGRGYRLGP